MALKRFAFACITAALLAGCGTTQFNGYSEAPAAQISIAQNPYIHSGVISGYESQVVLYLANSCHTQHAAQMAGAGQSVVNGAVPYGLAGLGVGVGAVGGFPGAKFGQYGVYGVAADGAEGAVNGAVTGSYSLDTATANCTWHFSDQLNAGKAMEHPEFPGLFDGLDVEAATGGKAWGGDRPPALDPNAKWPTLSTAPSPAPKR